MTVPFPLLVPEYDPTAYRRRRSRPAWVEDARVRYLAGDSLREISQAVGISTTSLSVWRLNEQWDRRANSEARAQRRPAWEVPARAAYESGVDINAVAALAGVRESRLRDVAKLLGWNHTARWDSINKARREGMDRPERTRMRTKAHRFARRAMRHAPMPIELARIRSEGIVCPYCSSRLTEGRVTIDHIEPLIRGGTNDPENLTACCGRCNRSKGDKTLLLWLARRFRSE